MEPDASLLHHPVFSSNFVAGRGTSRLFTRGENDLAPRAMEAIGATRVPADSIGMCAWNAIRQTLEIIRLFANEDDISHVYKLPDRRAADGAQKHIWYYGARLGPTASGRWSNLVEGEDQHPNRPSDKRQRRREPRMGTLYVYGSGNFDESLPRCTTHLTPRTGFMLQGLRSPKKQSSATREVWGLPVLRAGNPRTHPSH